MTKASDVAAELDAVITPRAATPGRSEDGTYPASVVEVADEVARWIDCTARTDAPGLAHLVVDALCVMPSRESAAAGVGRDLTAQDVRDAAMKWLKETSDPFPFECIAAHLNRITRPTVNASE